MVALAGAAVPPVLAQSDEVPGLILRVLSGPGPDADRAAERLAYLGPRRAGPALRTLLASADPHARLAATSALELVHDPAAASLLVKALGDDDWETRRNAAMALAGIKAKMAVRALQIRLRKDPETRVRMACVKALRAIGGGSSALIAAAGRDNSFDVRLAALDALAHVRDSGVRVRLRRLLNDPSDLIRFTTARALASQGDTAGRRFIERAVASRNAEDARRAITVAADVPGAWTMKLFEKGLAYPDSGVACAAAVALAKRHDIRGVRYLAKIAGQDTREGTKARDTLEDLGIAPSKYESLAAGQ